ncbi:hypothetical protein DMJ13_10855 [halophilic archaeon]|nr:hypothetical protein DMJ13_10855 [halophilic archaeon]
MDTPESLRATEADNVARLFEATADRRGAAVAVEMSEGYGLTETTAATHTGVGSTFGTKHGSIGQPLLNTGRIDGTDFRG